MSKVKPKLNLTQVGRVCVTVADTDRAIDFYVDALGFEKTVDVPMGDAGGGSRSRCPGPLRPSRLRRRLREPRQEAARRVSASTRRTSTRITLR